MKCPHFAEILATSFMFPPSAAEPCVPLTLTVTRMPNNDVHINWQLDGSTEKVQIFRLTVYEQSVWEKSEWWTEEFGSDDTNTTLAGMTDQ